MPRKRQYTFHLFRYQILPISLAIQLELGIDEEYPIESLDDLLARKNEFFMAALEETEKFRFHRAETIRRVEGQIGSFFVLRLGAARGVTVVTREFTEAEIEDWPNVLIIFNNDPGVQKTAIQLNPRAFYRTTTVANILERNLNEHLRQRQLAVRFNPIFEESYFWDIVAQHRGKITQAEFEMVSPNLPEISGALSLDLEELHRRTNTQETNLRLKSDPESSLTIKPDDEFIQGLVGYASKGGGNISVKVRGIRRRIQTTRGITEHSIDEVNIEGASTEEVVQLFGGLLT